MVIQETGIMDAKVIVIAINIQDFHLVHIVVKYKTGIVIGKMEIMISISQDVLTDIPENTIMDVILIVNVLKENTVIIVVE